MGDMSTAIVTGASRGLGLALTTALVAQGWSVVVDARDGEALTAAVAGLGDAVVAVPGDVTEPAHRERLVDEARRVGGLDLLVNNASLLGASPQPLLADYPLDVWREVYEVNVVAPIALIQLCLPILSPGGVIVNVTSDAATEAYAGWGGYGSSKAALEQASNVLAGEAPGLHVYWVDPGDMNTRMHQEAFPTEDISDRPPPEASVPGIIELIQRRAVSGRYQARRVVVGR
jgi:NAD(P)-dependent dehydrogenase (short-subunit alcohol dehydrogenase family)